MPGGDPLTGSDCPVGMSQTGTTSTGTMVDRACAPGCSSIEHPIHCQPQLFGFCGICRSECSDHEFLQNDRPLLTLLPSDGLLLILVCRRHSLSGLPGQFVSESFESEH